MRGLPHLRHGRRQPHPCRVSRRRPQPRSRRFRCCATARQSRCRASSRAIAGSASGRPSSSPPGASSNIPQAVEAILEGGHEIAHHSYIHENPLRADRATTRRIWLDARHRDHRARHRQGPARLARAALQFLAPLARPAARARLRLRRLADGRRHPLCHQEPQDRRRVDRAAEPLGPRRLAAMGAVLRAQLHDAGAQRASRASSSIRKEFEAAYAHGGLWVPVLHPFCTGRLARWHVFARVSGEGRRAGRRLVRADGGDRGARGGAGGFRPLRPGAFE